MPPLSALVRFRISLLIFIIGLVLSGVTAFPLLTELRLLTSWMGLAEAQSPENYTGLAHWLLVIRFGLEEMYGKFPWIAYGTDWLAFGHIVIALFFIHPWLYPQTSRPNLIVGLWACVLVLPLAMICGQIRAIPFAWRLVDCSFGLLGAVPLLYCLSLLKRLQKS